MKKTSAFLRKIKKAFWDDPVKPDKQPDNIRLQEVNKEARPSVIEYQGQRICLNSQQLATFHKMNREEKRQVKNYWMRMERRGEVIFQEVDGQLIAVRNKDYEERAKKLKQ